MRQVAAELEALLEDRTTEAAHIEFGRTVGGRYDIEARIGEGGFSQIFRAKDRETGAIVALKELKAELADADVHVKRFQREASLLRQFQHAHIVNIIDSLTAGNRHYIIMPYIGGGDLRHRLCNGPLPVKQVLTLSTGIADALEAAHQAGVIHRDIKPENILLDAKGMPLVTDFGVARGDAMTALTAADNMVGTLLYTAPEILNGEAPSPASDSWAFAILVYEMLTGSTPFKRDTLTQTVMAILNDLLPSLVNVCAECPDALIDLLTHMLVRDPQKRRADMGESARTMQELLDTVEV
jgi:eukaryotic-like serine/threonine-protein kinase